MKTNPFTKILFPLVIACVAIFSIYSCSSDDKDEPLIETPSLSIGMPDGSAAPSSLQMPAEAGTKSLAIVSNTTWKITKKGDHTDWLTVTPQQGTKNGEIKITVNKNPKASKREVTLEFAVGDKEKFKSYIISQESHEPSLSVTPEKPETVSESGGKVTFTIDAENDKWEYSIANNPNWLTEKEKTATSLTLIVDENPNNERTASITFKLTDFSSVTKDIEITQGNEIPLVADMLDVEFNLDGTAKDLSPMKLPVQKIEFDYPFTVAYNDAYNRNAVTFNPEKNGGSQPLNKGSYYRIDYQDNPEFQQKLSDGHSFETLVKFDVDYSTDQNHETKFFSTHERGGTGFLISNPTQGTGHNGITFLPNVPATEGGGSNWIWANSQVRPDGQSWYHLVGIWDKEAGKAFLYVNGEKKVEVDAAGYYRPMQLDEAWLAIGGDPGNGIIQDPFAGSLAIARIYDKALTEAEVQILWNKVK